MADVIGVFGDRNLTADILNLLEDIKEGGTVHQHPDAASEDSHAEQLQRNDIRTEQK